MKFQVGDRVRYKFNPDRVAIVFDVLEPVNDDGYFECFHADGHGHAETPPYFIVWDNGGTSALEKDLESID